MLTSFFRKTILAILLLVPFYTPIGVITGRLTNTGAHIGITLFVSILVATIFVYSACKNLAEAKELASKNTLVRTIIAYAAVLTIYLVFSELKLSATVSFFHHIVPFFVFLGIFFLRRISILDRTFLASALKVLVFSFSIVALFAIMQYYFLPRDVLNYLGYSEVGIKSYQLVGVNEDNLRVISTTAGPNSLGIYAAFMLPVLFMARRIINGTRTNKLITILIIITPLVVYVSKSRTGMVGLIFSALCALLMNREYIHNRLKNNNLYHVVTLLAVLVILTPLAIMYLNPNIGLSRGGSGIDTSDGQRLRSWELGVNRILDNPLGNGLGTAGIGSFYRPDGPNIIENYFLQVGYEIGLFGLIMVLFMFALVLFRITDIKDRYLKYCLFSVLGVTVLSCMFLPALSDELLAIIPFFILGMILGMTKSSLKNHNKA